MFSLAARPIVPPAIGWCESVSLLLTRDAPAEEPQAADDNYQLYVSGEQAARGFAADAKTGDLYVIGGAGPNWGAGDTDWIVRKKAFGSGTWIKDDDFKFGSYSGAQAITANGSGNIYVGGSGSDATSSHWLVRRH